VQEDLYGSLSDTPALVGEAAVRIAVQYHSTARFFILCPSFVSVVQMLQNKPGCTGVVQLVYQAVKSRTHQVVLMNVGSNPTGNNTDSVGFK